MTFPTRPGLRPGPFSMPRAGINAAGYQHYARYADGGAVDDDPSGDPAKQAYYDSLHSSAINSIIQGGLRGFAEGGGVDPISGLGGGSPGTGVSQATPSPGSVSLGDAGHAIGAGLAGFVGGLVGGALAGPPGALAAGYGARAAVNSFFGPAPPAPRANEDPDPAPEAAPAPADPSPAESQVGPEGAAPGAAGPAGVGAAPGPGDGTSGENGEGTDGNGGNLAGGGIAGGFSGIHQPQTRGVGANRSVPHGLVASQTPGRADAVTTKVPAGTYIVPADVTSIMGQGNTLAGKAKLDGHFGTAPSHAGFAAGGMVDVRLSGGEYRVSPDKVAGIGGGSIERGRQILDGHVKRIREEEAHRLRTTPGPKQ